MVATRTLAQANTGPLVLWKRPETGTYARANRDIIESAAVDVRNWIDPDFDAGIIANTHLTGTSLTAMTTQLQAALTNAPMGSTLLFPRGLYCTNAQLNLTRQIDLLGHNMLIDANLPTGTTNLLNVRVGTDQIGNGDIRLMQIEGMALQLSSGGQNCLDIENASPSSGISLMTLRRCRLFAGDTGTGAGLRFGGQGGENQKHLVELCYIKNSAWLDGCTDAIRLVYNTFFGNKVAVLADLATGAFRTAIEHNVMVARQGALVMKRGSQVDFCRNQIEHPLPITGDYLAAVTLDTSRNTTDHCRGVNICENNFGGGTNPTGGPSTQLSILLKTGNQGLGIEDTLIEGNTFGKTNSGVDIQIDDAKVRYTTISRKRLRGVRGSAGFMEVAPYYPTYQTNTDDTDKLLNVVDSGYATGGVYKDATALGGANAAALIEGFTCSSSFCFWRDDEIVRFDSYITAPSGSAYADQAFALLPVGFRPAQQVLGKVVGFNVSTGAVVEASYNILTNGYMLLTMASRANACNLFMQPLVFRVARSPYNPGA